MNSPLQPVVARAWQGRIIQAFGQTAHILLSSEQTGGTLMVANVLVPAQNGPPPHIHADEDELFFVRRGQFEFWINGKTFVAGPGDVVYGPRQVPHTFTNIGDETGELRLLTVDGNFESFFRACSTAQSAGAPLAAITKIAAEHQLTFCDAQTPGPDCSQHNARPKIITAGEGERLSAFGDKIRVFVTGEDSGNSFACGEVETPSCSGPPLHVHEREDELFWIEQGIYDVRVGDERYQLHPGDVFYAPRGVAHTFRVVSDEPGKTICAMYPSGFENFFGQCADIFAAGKATPQLLSDMAGQHGIRFLPPRL